MFSFPLESRHMRWPLNVTLGWGGGYYFFWLRKGFNNALYIMTSCSVYFALSKRAGGWVASPLRYCLSQPSPLPSTSKTNHFYVAFIALCHCVGKLTTNTPTHTHNKTVCIHQNRDQWRKGVLGVPCGSHLPCLLMYAGRFRWHCLLGNMVLNM